MVERRAEVLQEMKSSVQYRLDSGKWRYCGPLGFGADMHWLAKRFYYSWHQQKKRCCDPKHKQFSDYGAKGIQHLWSVRECIDWAVNEYLTRESWTRPAISRLGDVGNYESGNVKLIEQSENRKEMAFSPVMRSQSIALGISSRRRVIFFNVNDTGDVLRFDSGRHASEFLGKNRNFIQRSISLGRSVEFAGKTYLPKWED